MCPNQRFRRTVVSKDWEVVVAGIVSEKRKDGVVALFPVGSVDLMMCPNLYAVVEAVALSGESVDQELRPVFTVEAVLSREDLDEKILKMNRAVGKVDRKGRKIAH
jgi:hypothetical protein